MPKNNKIRIKDIAILAGVSEGTVDRVLHNRGEVSQKSKEAVQKVLDEMHYSPNLLARSLASKKHYRFTCLIPSYQPGDYWESVERGFDLAAQDFIHYNITLEKVYFDQFDVVSFKTISAQIIVDKPDAVLMAPIFSEEALNFIGQLKMKHIPVSFIDSLIEEADFVTYYGQNSFQSGYVAAKLLLNSLPENSQIIIIRTKRMGSESNQTKSRKAGFMHFIHENELPNIELINIEFIDRDEQANFELIRDVFEKNQNIKAAITFNSKVHRLAMHLDTLGRKGVRLIGYDLLEKNVHYLKTGIVSYLLAQRPDKQAYLTVRDMCSELILKQEISKINYVPIDVLMKENIEDYMHFRE